MRFSRISGFNWVRLACSFWRSDGGDSGKEKSGENPKPASATPEINAKLTTLPLSQERSKRIKDSPEHSETWPEKFASDRADLHARERESSGELKIATDDLRDALRGAGRALKGGQR